MTGNDEEEDVRKRVESDVETHRKDTRVVDMQYMPREGGQALHSCCKHEIA